MKKSSKYLYKGHLFNVDPKRKNAKILNGFAFLARSSKMLNLFGRYNFQDII